MSPLIKSDAATAVRAFAGMRVPAPAAGEAEPDPRDVERSRLLAEIERLRRELAETEAAAARAADEARAAGRSEGLADAEKREAEGLDALRASLEAAGADFATRLDLLDRLAPELARLALSRLFAGVEGWSAAAEAMIARQLAELRRSTVVAIRVSRLDFPDRAALDRLAATLAAETLRIESDGDLRAGAARIECRLGQIELDARDQLQAVAALLAEMTA